MMYFLGVRGEIKRKLARLFHWLSVKLGYEVKIVHADVKFDTLMDIDRELQLGAFYKITTKKG